MKILLSKCIPALVLLSTSCQSAFDYDCYHPAEIELMKDVRHACDCFEAVDPYGNCSFDDWERINVLLLKIMDEPSDELMSEWKDMIKKTLTEKEIHHEKPFIEYNGFHVNLNFMQ